MKYIDEFRDPNAAQEWARRIASHLGRRQATLMEVCGTHTMAARRYGVPSLLPSNLNLSSGPGCPVCVTPKGYLDRAIALAHRDRLILATFGDMMKVPGSSSSLEREKAEDADVRVVYSPLDAVKMAAEHPEQRVVFLGIGFEATAPGIAASIWEAARQKLENYFVLAAPKVMPPPMRALASDPELKIDGFLCPGHVSTIIGSEPYRFLAEEYGVPCVIAGFEPLDLLQALCMLVDQIVDGRSEVEIQYSRAVRPEGNPRARAVIEDAFEPTDAEWRGLGIIPDSGLRIRDRYKAFDAERVFEIEVEPTVEHPGCLCGQILKGIKVPTDCGLFGTVCTPSTPQGACMVSSEGTCAAYYRYR